MTEKIYTSGQATDDGWIEFISGSPINFYTDGAIDYFRVCRRGPTVMNGFIRFVNVDLPKDTPIVSAYLELVESYEYTEEEARLRIIGQASPNPTTFSSIEDYLARPKTTNYVDCLIPPLQTREVWRTPDIKSIIQEVIGLPDWQAGNAIAIFLNDNGTINSRAQRELLSFESVESVYRPKLVVALEAPAHSLTINSSPITAPVILNGQSIGNTPLNLTLVEGLYNIEVPVEVTE